MKSILITGGAGYIGSSVAYSLSQQNYHIIILDTFVHQQTFDQKNATIIKADFAQEEALEKIFTTYAVEAVIHCAANIEVGLSVIDPAVFYENNVAKTIILLQTMLAHDVKKIIFSSSCAVYGNPLFLPLTEDHPKNPLNAYGRTKLMVEMILEDFYKAYDLRYVALRYFNAAGALPELNLGEQHKPETHIIPLLLQAALNNKIFTVFGSDYQTEDGTAIRDYVHIIDIAQAHSNALEYLINDGKSDCFNLGTGSGVSIAHMVKMVEKITTKKINVKYVDKRCGDAPLLVADTSKAQKILNWKALFSEIDTIILTSFAFETRNSKITYFQKKDTKKKTLIN